MARQAALELPEAPQAPAMVIEADALPFTPAGARPRPRDFVPPRASPRVARRHRLPAPPEVAGRVAGGRPDSGAAARLRPPPDRPMDRRARTLEAARSGNQRDPFAIGGNTMAIVGLNPANTREVPPPPGSRPAGFSAGPEVRKEGSSGAINGLTMLNVPGLTVRGGAKDNQPTLALPPFSPTSRENLIAAARSVGGIPARPPSPSATRTSEAPDPRLAGRVVYAIAIQMPNVTSYSGSWLVWFAERAPLPGMAPVDMQAPVPLRKVDPKYVAAAAAERVEGSIRLAAVIGKDGHVGQISLIHHLDDRLDRTAAEALGKWEFTPALRNGSPVEVDAVFEIPFRLAPRPGK